MRGLPPAVCCTVDVAEEGCQSSSSWSLQGLAGLSTEMRPWLCVWKEMANQGCWSPFNCCN